MICPCTEKRIFSLKGSLESLESLEDVLFRDILEDVLFREILEDVLFRGSLKRYPEIGDRPEKVLSNPPKDSIEPLRRFYLTQEVLSNPHLAIELQ